MESLKIWIKLWGITMSIHLYNSYMFWVIFVEIHIGCIV